MRKYLSTIALCTMLLGIIIPSADASFLDFTGIDKDTTPSLGANLTVGVSNYSITSSGAGNIVIAPGGNNDFHINTSEFYVDVHPSVKVGIGIATPGHALSVDGDLAILETGGDAQHYTILRGGTQTTTVTYNLPDDDGDNEDVLYISGSSKLNWHPDQEGLGSLSDDPAPTLGANLTVGGYEIVSDAGSVAIAPGGTGDFRVNTSDLFIEGTNSRVGIGTVTPGTELDVAGEIKATTFVGDLSGDAVGAATSASTLPSANTSCSANYGATGIDEFGDSEGCIDVRTQTEQTTAGYLTASTIPPNTALATPTFETAIQVPLLMGGTGIDDNLTFQPTLYATSTGDMHFLVGDLGGTEAMTILSDGKIGIGDTTPSMALSVVGSDNTSSNYGLYVTNTDNDPSFFVRNDGVVGLSTTSPSQFFHVEENSDADSAASINKIARFTHLTSGAPAADIGVGFEFGVENSAGTDVAIAAIDAVVTDVGAETDGAIVFSTLNGATGFLAERMRIASDGKVGIGTTAAPARMLHINGSTEQLRIARDVDTYFSTTVSDEGAVTFDVTEMTYTPSFDFSDDTVKAKESLIVEATGTTTSHRIDNTGYEFSLGSSTNGEIAYQNGGLQLAEDPDVLTFVLRDASFPSGTYIKTTNYARSFLYDFSGDGLLDFIIGGGGVGTVDYYENDGTGVGENTSYKTVVDNFIPTPAAVGADPPGGNYWTTATPAFAQMDDTDGVDLVLGYYMTSGLNSSLLYMTNDGTDASPTWSFETQYLGGDMAKYSMPTVGDFDGDGLPDVAVGYRGGTVSYYENTGTTTAPVLTLQNADWLDGALPYLNVAPEFVDMDSDGDLDLVVGNHYFVRYYRNDGQADTANPDWTLVSDRFIDRDFSVYEGGYVTPRFGDMDYDGDLDAVVSTNSGYTQYWEGVNTGGYEATGEFISQTFTIKRNTISPIAYGTLTWTADVPEGTTLGIQLQSDEGPSNDYLGGESWRGPDGTSDTYYTASGTQIHSAHGDRIEDRMIRYKVVMTGNTHVTPTISDIDIEFTYAPSDTVINGAAEGDRVGEVWVESEYRFMSAFQVGNYFAAATGGTIQGKWGGDPIPFGKGGSGVTSYLKGDMLYGLGNSSEVEQMGKIPIAGEGAVLAVGPGSKPTWTRALNIDLETGNIGIGTANPRSAFHVADGHYAQFDHVVEAVNDHWCISPARDMGRISIRPTSLQFCYCDKESGGVDWWNCVDLIDPTP